jgi:hypothetical protein
MMVTNVLTIAGATISQMTTIEEITRMPLVPTNVPIGSQTMLTMMLHQRTTPFTGNLSDCMLI